MTAVASSSEAIMHTFNYCNRLTLFMPLLPLLLNTSLADAT
jgi:hypothetical protein